MKWRCLTCGVQLIYNWSAAIDINSRLMTIPIECKWKYCSDVRTYICCCCRCCSWHSNWVQISHSNGLKAKLKYSANFQSIWLNGVGVLIMIIIEHAKSFFLSLFNSIHFNCKYSGGLKVQNCESHITSGKCWNQFCTCKKIKLHPFLYFFRSLLFSLE